jgi:hypothetical protein
MLQPAPVDANMCVTFHDLVQQGCPKMNASSRFKIVVPLVSAIALFALSAHAEDQPKGNGQPPPGKQMPSKAAVQTPKAVQAPRAVQGRPPGGGQGGGPNARYARGALPTRDYGGQAYRGHLAWEGGRWHHEVHNGRDGYWWDVGGVWYYYPQPMDGPPTYISEDYADDVPYGAPPVDAQYAPPPGAYAPPPPDPAASAIGGAVVGGLLGGLLTGRATGAAAGAVIGGATGAIAGATAAAQPGYYWAQGNCYYRYPSGQYVQADPRACY